MKRPVRHHIYIPGESNQAPVKPEQLCATCLLPQRNQRHQLPDIPQSVLAEEARRLGEGDHQ